MGELALNQLYRGVGSVKFGPDLLRVKFRAQCHVSYSKAERGLSLPGKVVCAC